MQSEAATYTTEIVVLRTKWSNTLVKSKILFHLILLFKYIISNVLLTSTLPIQDSRDASEEQALNSSNLDGSYDLIELSDDDEFDEVMAEVIIFFIRFVEAFPV